MIADSPEPVQRQGRPLKDIDVNARVRLVRAAVYLVPTGLVLGATASVGFGLSGMGPIAALAAGFALGFGGVIVAYIVFEYVLGSGPLGVIRRLYGDYDTGTPAPADSWRARALIAAGKPAQAVEELELEIAVNPEDPAAMLRAARLSAMELRDPERAIGYYERARRTGRLDPETDQYVAMRLSELHLAVGEADEAEAELRRLLRSHPGSRYAAAARTRLAELARARGGSRDEEQST